MRSGRRRRSSAAAVRANRGGSTRSRSRGARRPTSRPVVPPSGLFPRDRGAYSLRASLGSLDENILSGCLRRALPDAEQARAEDHLRHCADCRRLIGGMAEVFGSSSQRLGGTAAVEGNAPEDPLADAPSGLLAGGTSVGRYVI